METFVALTDAERKLFEALNERGVRYLVVGLSAAVLQGANTGTRDIDIWFADLSDTRIGDAVRAAHGIWIGGSFGMRPPQIGGDEIGDRIDVVTHMDGLADFNAEFANSIEVSVDGVSLRLLPLSRIIASKRASKRPKDAAALPALEEALAAIDEAKELDARREEILAARAKVKAQYGPIYDKVSSLMFEDDPINIHSPVTDEYEPEVDTILPRLAECKSALDARRVIHEELVRWFDASLAGKEEALDDLAKKVWAAWCEVSRARRR